MNIYVICLIIGLCLQVYGGVGYLVNTAIEKTKNTYTTHMEIRDNETGDTLAIGEFNTDVLRTWKMVKREK